MRPFLTGILIPFLVLIGCGGGSPVDPGNGDDTHLIVGVIQGPDIVEENTSPQYSVDASGDTGITYHWTVEPDTLGSFTNPTSPTTMFNAGEVSQDTAATIRVVVSSDNGLPVHRTKQITILNTPVDELTVGEIQGPDSADENTTEEFSITALGDTNITYDWSIDPLSAGQIENSVISTVSIEFAEMDADIQAQLQVTVNSDNGGPEIRTKLIAINDVPPKELQIGDIQGPSVVYELVPENYSINASGGEWYSYQWSVVPEEAGVFATPQESVTLFTAEDIGSDTERVIEISVFVESDAGSGSKSLAVTVLSWADPGTYLSAGHPMTGMNYRRNNRSTSLLPSSLDIDDYMQPSCPEGSAAGLFVAGDERLYFSTYMHDSWAEGPSMGHNVWEDDYRLYSFFFGDDCGDGVNVGWDTVITANGALSSGRFRHHKWPAGHSDYSWSVYEHYRINRFGVFPDVLASEVNQWGASMIPSHPALGSSYTHFLPLPDGRVVSSLMEEHYSGSDTFAVQMLNWNLEPVITYDLPAAVTGLAFDGADGIDSTIYVNTDFILYAFSLDLSLKWSTESILTEFSNGYPVIANDGGIIGIKGGILRRVEPDGTLGQDQDIGGYTMPVCLHDGSIAVITDDYVSVFDISLNPADQIPLPTGTGTGNTYSTPLVDADNSFALYRGPDLYIIDRSGNVIDQRAFDADISLIRLGPDHLFVLVGDRIYRFPN